MKRSARRPPKMPAISEEMKGWSAALEREVGDWPKLTTRIFFGFTALYRGECMFAALPRTRGMQTPNSLALRFEATTPKILARIEKDPRITAFDMQKKRWFTFEVSSDTDLHGALEWLGQAYQAAGKPKKSR